jgi:hypothetical protein
MTTRGPSPQSHAVFRKLYWMPVGFQGAVQHTYTRACDGFHAAGACPPPSWPAWKQFNG